MDAYRRFRPGFEAAMDPRLYTIDYLDDRLVGGGAYLWNTEQAAIVAEIRTYPTGAKVIHGLVATGKLDDIVNLLIPAAEAWAREQGCIGAVIESREGWGRVLKSNGYEAYQSAVWKDL